MMKSFLYLHFIRTSDKLKFEWDENKNEENICKHGINFVDVPEIFNGPLVVGLDTRRDYGEDRWLMTGILQDMIIAVVMVERGDDVMRIISARKVGKNEKQKYEKIIKNGLGTT